MPKGYPNPKPEPVVEPDEPVISQQPSEVVELVRHYRPVGPHIIVGHTKAAVVRKLTTGETVELEKEVFIKGQMAPAPFPGAALSGKIWAGTRIALMQDEAKTIVRTGIAKREWAD